MEIADLEGLIAKLAPRVLSLVHEKQFGFIRDGNSAGLGGDFDKELLIALRQRSELIVTSGKTAEIEQYRQPSKPLVLLSTRPNSAPWLEAQRLTLEDPRFTQLLADKMVLFETGLTLSRVLYQMSLIDQVVVHHDQGEFDADRIIDLDLKKEQSTPFHGRYISVFGRGS